MNAKTKQSTTTTAEQTDIEQLLTTVQDCYYHENDIDLGYNVSDLSVLQVNIRGLINKQNELKNIINRCSKGRQLDIVIISETWLNATNEHLLCIPGYELISKPRIGRKGGGVAILVSKYLKYRRRSDWEIQCETENCMIEVHTGKTNIVICSVYRPPNTDTNDFLKFIDSLTNRKYKNMIVGLDHNLDFLKLKQHKHTKEFLDKLIEQDLLPTITKPTRITKSTATLIDNILLSTKLNTSYKCGILIDDTSDHLPCFVRILDAKPALRKPEVVTSRKLDDKTIKHICNSLERHDWTPLYDMKENCDSCFNYFHTTISSVIESNAPLKSKTVYHKRPLEPWITKGLLRSIQKQKRLYKITLSKNCSDSDRTKYTQYKSCLTKVKRRCKLDYYHNKCVDYKRNTKKLWKLINTACGKFSDKSSIIECINSNGINHYESTKIANEMANYFANVGKNFAGRISQSERCVYDYNKKIKFNEKSVYLTPTNKFEVEKIVKNLDNKQSSGHDDISNTLLKKLIPHISEPLAFIFNKSMTEGTFPEQMKIADVVPLYKGKCKSYANNYRPISLLLTMSKILEKLIHKRTYSHLDQSNQIFNSQYGFRTKHSCENAIGELTSEIVKSRELGHHTLCTFLDLSKAFDTLDHNILYDKMYRYGIRGPCLNWYKSYLSNRKLRVKCKSEADNCLTYSDLFDVNIGTPQGSCLGPLIFLIFTNDIHLHLEHVSSILFADDTTLYISHRNLRYAKWCLSEDLKLLSDWFKANKLTLNLSKTVAMHFTNKTNAQLEHLEIGCYNIPVVKETKFLGVWVDNKLNWKNHITKLEGKLKMNLHLLKRSKNILSRHTKKLVYYAHIYSHLSYCILVWGCNVSKTSLKGLQKIQDDCVSIIMKKKKVTDKDYKDLKFMKINEIIKLELQKFGYKLVNNLLPVKIKEAVMGDQFKQTLSKTHHYNTRHKALPNKPKSTCGLYLNNFICRWHDEYMPLPVATKKSINIHAFTKECKKLIITS